MKITLENMTFNADGRLILLSFIDGEVMMDGDDEAIASLSINEMSVLKEEALKLFLQEFGDTI